MNDCTNYQPLLLDHLYGLLDDAENQALLDHLGACPACQASLDRARRQQRLLAAAAKQAFPAVRFEAPAREEVAPEVIALPVPRRARRWGRWAVAAALLLAAGGLGAPAAWYGSDYVQARATVRHHADQLAQAEQHVNRLGEQLNELAVEQQRETEKVREKARERQINLVVSGPQRPQVGAPSEYRIETRNLDGLRVASRLDMRLVDPAKKEVVFEQRDVPSDGEYQLTLQPNLPLRPGATLALEVNARRDGDADAASSLSERLDLTAPVYVTHLATDRPMYQPGDTVRFRSLTLERFGLKPPAEDFQLVYTLTKPSGEKSVLLSGTSRLMSAEGKGELTGPDQKPLRGLGSGEFTVEPGAAGGEYTLTVSDTANRFAPQERKFLVNAYQPSALNKELNFDRSSYGAGDTVVARVKVTREGGEPAAHCQATAVIFIDGQRYGTDGQPGGQSPPVKADEHGKVDVAFKLPQAIERGEASLSVELLDRNVPDVIVRTIPLVLKKLQVEFFPEGGDLIAGAENRVYFQVRTTLDKPGDLRGKVVDDRGAVVVDGVQTLTDAEEPGANQGLGVFTLRPEAGRKYELKIDSPLGVTGKHELPEVKADGVVLSVPDGVTGPDEPIRVKVSSPRAGRTLLVGAYCRGQLLDHQMVTVKQGATAEVALRPSQGAGGVYRITAFEDQGGQGANRKLVPRAERLVYRQPKEQLHLAVRPSQSQFIPGDKVSLTVTARDEQGRPTGAVVLLSAVDKRTLTMADEKTARTMPTHFLLTTEVLKPEDLEHADFLLTDKPQARLALDLLLGTQGWRRFAEQKPAEFRKRFPEDAERLLVTTGQLSQKVSDFAEEEVKRVEQDFGQRLRKAQEERNEAAAGLAAVRGDTAAREAAARVRRYDNWVERYGRYAAPVAGLLLLVLILGILVATLPRSVTRSAPFSFGALVGGVAVLLLTLLPFLGSTLAPEQKNEAMARRDADAAAAASSPQIAKEAPRKAGHAPAPMEAAPPMPLAPPASGAAGLGGGMPGMPAPLMMEKADGAKGEGKLADDMLRNGHGLEMMKKGPKPGGFNLAEAEKLKLQAKREEFDRGAGRQDKDARRQLEQMGKQKGGEAPLGGARGPAGFGGGRANFAARRPAPPPLVVREYFHQNRSANAQGLRTDFAETLLWQPALVVPPEGQATVSFQLCNSVTTFEVAAAGHTLDGRLGTATTTVESRLPFTLEPKTPIEVSSADRIDLPVTISNNTTESRAVSLSAAATNLEFVGDKKPDAQLTVAGESAARRVYGLRPKVIEGEARVEFRGQTQPFAADSIARTFRVVPDGFPVVGSRSDLLEGTAANEVVLPATWVKGTLKCRVEVYPSTLASLQKGLEGLLREPNGCFEQTSTSNYPNVLILDYLKENNQARPDVEARAQNLLARGYQKLTSFECPKRVDNTKQGYEWFGAPDGAHEALTAYGLLEFRDMARVYKVDPAMLERTRQYLLAARDGQGGFRRNPRALDSFGRAPQHITNAYIVWALTESGKDDDVTRELDALLGQAKGSKDPYFLGLVANSLLNRDRSADAVALLKTAATMQKEDGHLDAEKTSITGSGGRDLQIETTALAVLGWLKANRPADFTVATEKAVRWIGQQRGGYGGFGSTQSTILALKALIAHARANKKAAEAGELTLSVGDVRVGQGKLLAGAQDVLTVEMAEPERYLKPGANKVQVRLTGKNSFPYTLTWSYQTLTPVGAEECAVRLATQLDRDAADEGQVVHLSVTLENLKDQGQGMAVAIIGLPGGLSLPEDLKQLKEHARLRENGTKPGLISTFETRGRELILYWRDLAPRQKIEVPIDLVCRVPGEYRGPASRAYLYYNADAKHWAQPLSMKVTAKE
jgi:anti-sigma factor RsiW